MWVAEFFAIGQQYGKNVCLVFGAADERRCERAVLHEAVDADSIGSARHMDALDAFGFPVDAVFAVAGHQFALD